MPAASADLRPPLGAGDGAHPWTGPVEHRLGIHELEVRRQCSPHRPSPMGSAASSSRAEVIAPPLPVPVPRSRAGPTFGQKSRGGRPAVRRGQGAGARPRPPSPAVGRGRWATGRGRPGTGRHGRRSALAVRTAGPLPVVLVKGADLVQVGPDRQLVDDRPGECHGARRVRRLSTGTGWPPPRRSLRPRQQLGRRCRSANVPRRRLAVLPSSNGGCRGA